MKINLDHEIGPNVVTLSEGSVAMGSEMLRYAQHDRAVTIMNTWINL